MGAAATLGTDPASLVRRFENSERVGLKLLGCGCSAKGAETVGDGGRCDASNLLGFLLALYVDFERPSELITERRTLDRMESLCLAAVALDGSRVWPRFIGFLDVWWLDPGFTVVGGDGAVCPRRT